MVDIETFSQQLCLLIVVICSCCCFYIGSPGHEKKKKRRIIVVVVGVNVVGHTYTAPTKEPGDLQSSEVLFLFSSLFSL